MRVYPVCLILCVSLGVVAATAGQPEESDAVRPFNGKNLDGWKFKMPVEESHWLVGNAEIDPDDPSKLVVRQKGKLEAEPQLVNATGGGVDTYTSEEWGDQIIELELMVPKGSNSGVYVMGEYEVQVLDSYGKEKIGPGDIGGLYGAAAPRVNAAKKPGEWQTLRIEFQAPRFENDSKTSNALFRKVVLNGKTIHENVEMKGPTPSRVTGKESEKGPLMFQGNHGPVAYRNIRISLPEQD